MNISELFAFRPISFYPQLRQVTGSIPAAIMLQQLLYWWPRRGEGEETIYKTEAEMQAETSLTPAEQKSAIKALKGAGFITVQRKGLPAKRHFVIHEDAVNDALISLTRSAKSAELFRRNPPNCSGEIRRTNTENTTETTTEKDTLSSAPADDRSPRKKSLPVSEAFEAWNRIAGGAGLPKARALTPQRRQKMRTRLNEMKAIGELEPIAIWQAALRQLIRSPHHMGENERGWRANIDFMLQAGRWQQFFEPVADAVLKQAQRQQAEAPVDSEEARRARQLAEELKREFGLR